MARPDISPSGLVHSQHEQHIMPNNEHHILSIAPSTSGFGYALFEHPFRLIAWGREWVTIKDKNAGAMSHFAKLIDHSQPAELVLEDTDAKGCRRHERVRELLRKVRDRARGRGIQVFEIARLAVIKQFSSREGRATKHFIAELLAKTFPELVSMLPDRREIWESQSDRMSIFDAVALAASHLST